MKMPAELRQTPSPHDEAADWVYWDPQAKKFRRVELTAVPSDRPQRVRVQHLEADTGSRAEWVPARRLHVPWAISGEYFTSIEAERRLERHAPRTWESDLGAIVLANYVRPEVAETQGNGSGGVLRIEQLDTLARLSGLPAEEMTSHPDTVSETSTWYVPWPTFERVLIGVIQLDPAPAMRLLDAQTRDHQSFDLLVDAQGERWWMGGKDDSLAAKRMQQWHRNHLQQTALLRRWLDQRTPSLAESYVQLRGMYAELADAARAAVPRVRMVRAKVSDEIADRIESLLSKALPIADVRGLRTDREYEGTVDDY